MTPNFPRLSPVGIAGFAITFADTLNESGNRAALAFRAAIEAAQWRGVEECSTSLCSTFVRFDPLSPDAADLPARIERLLNSQDWTSAPLASGRRHFQIPCVIGGALGPQFADACNVAGMSETTARINLLASRTRVLTIGFAPGQPYAGQLDPEWDIPRLNDLNPSVPAGALVVAIRQLIIFANDTQTGWRHIGQTVFKCFDPGLDAPFALRPGDELSLIEVSQDELRNIQTDPKGTNGGAVVELLP